MPTTFNVIDEFGNRLYFARSGKGGIKRMYSRQPAMRPIRCTTVSHALSSANDPALPFAGAAAGALVAGPVGALVGAAALARANEIFFEVEIASGQKLLCNVKSYDWPKVGREIKQAIDRGAGENIAALAQVDPTAVEPTPADLSPAVPRRPFRIGIVLLWIGIVLLPILFSWITLHRRFSRTERALAFGWLGVFLVYSISLRI